MNADIQLPIIPPEYQEELERQIKAVREIYINVQGEIKAGDEEEIYDIAVAIADSIYLLKKHLDEEREKKRKAIN